MAQQLDRLGVIGDREAACGVAGVGPDDEIAGEDLWRLGGPEAVAGKGA